MNILFIKNFFVGFMVSEISKSIRIRLLSPNIDFKTYLIFVVN